MQLEVQIPSRMCLNQLALPVMGKNQLCWGELWLIVSDRDFKTLIQTQWLMRPLALFVHPVGVAPQLNQIPPRQLISIDRGSKEQMEDKSPSVVLG